MSIFKKIKNNAWMLRSIFHTIWFNFHYLPFKQAVKLPILLYKPTFVKLGGVISIDCQQVTFGMISLGKHIVSVHPNTGFSFENHGGTIVFKGKCHIGGNSAISVGKSSTVIFGDNFLATASLKVVSYIGISFGCGTRIGWDNIFMDTSFHPLYDIEKKKFKKAYGKVEIGDYNWFPNQCVVMHSVTTPKRCIFGFRSVITRGGKYESYAVHGGSPIKVLSRGVMRDLNNDSIKEYI